MDSKEMTGSIAKGIASFVLTILTLRGFRYVFSNNWLESIVIVVVATVVLYKWGVKWFGSYLWRRKLRTIGALICGFYLTTTGRIEEAGILTKIEYFRAGFSELCDYGCHGKTNPDMCSNFKARGNLQHGWRIRWRLL